MDFVQIMLIIGVLVGIVLVVVSFIGKRKDATEITAPPPGAYLEKRLEAMDSSITEADGVITELNDMSKNVIGEMDKKYNELLFLYNLIDEKKKEVSVLAPNTGSGPETENAKQTTLSAPGGGFDAAALKKDNFENPKLSQIMALYAQGMSVGQIARELDMGQGEVSLIMHLGDGLKPGR